MKEVSGVHGRFRKAKNYFGFSQRGREQHHQVETAVDSCSVEVQTTSRYKVVIWPMKPYFLGCFLIFADEIRYE